MPHSYVARVDQLDAKIWNEELFSLFNNQLRKAMQYVSPTSLVNIESELEAAFRLCFDALPLVICHSTLGQKLFRMQYGAKNKKYIFLPFVSVGLPWFWDRILRLLLTTSNPQKLRIIHTLERYVHVFCKLVSLVNFCLFLRSGTYSNVWERILKVKPTYPADHQLRGVHYESINQQLLWHGIAEFLTFVLPLLNVHSVKGHVKRLLKPLTDVQQTNLDFSKQKCAICNKVPIFPYEMGCRHTFCYYCLASNVAADERFLCTVCKHEASGISSIKPVCLNSGTQNLGALKTA